MDAQTDSRKDSGNKKPAWEMVGLPDDREYKAFKDSKAKERKSVNTLHKSSLFMYFFQIFCISQLS